MELNNLGDGILDDIREAKGVFECCLHGSHLISTIMYCAYLGSLAGGARTANKNTLNGL